MSSGRLLKLLRRASSSLALGVTDHAGRGLVARQPVQQGAVILSEVPLAAAPAPQHRGKVCYDCLRVSALAQPSLDVGGQAYCSAECADRAGGSYAAVEGPGGANFAGLVAYCTAHHERFPLLAARLACGIVQNGRSPAFEVQIVKRGNMFSILMILPRIIRFYQSMTTCDAFDPPMVMVMQSNTFERCSRQAATPCILEDALERESSTCRTCGCCASPMWACRRRSHGRRCTSSYRYILNSVVTILCRECPHESRNQFRQQE